jgi:hypothetical protein
MIVDVQGRGSPSGMIDRAPTPHLKSWMLPEYKDDGTASPLPDLGEPRAPLRGASLRPGVRAVRYLVPMAALYCADSGKKSGFPKSFTPKVLMSFCVSTEVIQSMNLLASSLFTPGCLAGLTAMTP